MKKYESFSNLPITEHPLIKHCYAGKFPQEQWEFLAKIEIKAFHEVNLDDQFLLKFFAGIYEVSNYDHVKEALESNNVSFKDLVNMQIEDEKTHHLSKQNKELSIVNNEEQPLTGMLYLLAKGFKSEVLDELMHIASAEGVVEHTTFISKVCKSEMTHEIKKQICKDYWDFQGLKVFFKDFLGKKEFSPKEFFDFINTSYSYENFKTLSKSKVASFFNDSTSMESYNKSARIYKGLANFFIHAENLINALPKDACLEETVEGFAKITL
ncbi:MAG: hypothetical protein H0U73_00720 [Tatlockia sp.]|nr:hypothetical protein [Tatlockia sp.]